VAGNRPGIDWSNSVRTEFITVLVVTAVVYGSHERPRTSPSGARRFLRRYVCYSFQMKFNRSVPPCTVIPVLIYPDPSAAADWLSRAFGFAIRLRIANHRIQMKAGDGCFTIAEGTVTPNNSHIIQVRIDDAAGHCERARQNGAIILTEPQDHAYGERQYNAEDFHGHRWDFTETIAYVAPEEWSGGGFHLE
jgi:uncharacterized glyoxalase superfamily protein PhnB